MDRILLGKGEQPVYLHAQYGNRHGLVAGATGTGKTVSLMVLAEGFSRLGVPVFMADVKGDVAGLAMPGSGGEKIQERARTIGVEGYAPEANPVVFWDLYGKSGHPVRTTISELGPTLLAQDPRSQRRAARRARDRVHAGRRSRPAAARPRRSSRAAHVRRGEPQGDFGEIRPRQRAVRRGDPARRAVARARGRRQLFGEPALELADLLRTDLSGRGIINVLAADQLILKPRLFSSFLLWLLSELFENLPEVGDLDKPKLVFMFDEAHLLFDDAPPALRERVEQVVRLIRSKGVGVYFCSQFPDDVPGEILGQLGNRVQHALRAFTPRDQKAVRTAAETFVANPKIDVAKVISTLAVGEALVSTLQEGGVPMPVQRTMMAPPRSRIGAITPEERATVRCAQPDRREVRHAGEPGIGVRDAERIAWVQRVQRVQQVQQVQRVQRVRRVQQAPTPSAPVEAPSKVDEFLWGTKRRQGMVETMAKQTARTVGSQLGRQILRGLLGGILGSQRTR